MSVERTLLVSPDFKETLAQLPLTIQEATRKQLRFLVSDPRRPSLQAHPLHHCEGMWDGYVTASYRMLYEPKGAQVWLWYLGPHEMVDHFKKRGLTLAFRFERLFPEPPEEPVGEAPFQIPEEWSRPRNGHDPDWPFAAFRSTHLRILGVPASLTKVVRDLPFTDDLVNVPLPEGARNLLEEICTSAKLAPVLVDPNALFFRTTLDRLEGYIQGHIKELMLNLSEEQRQFVERPARGDTLVRGAAGSGKTTILVYRAIALAEKGESVLLITYNRTLAMAMRTLLKDCIGELPPNLQVHNLDSYLVRLLQGRFPNLSSKIIKEGQHRELLQTALERARLGQNARRLFDILDRSHKGTSAPGQPVAAFAGLSPQNIQEEILRVIKSNGLRTLDEYLSFRRYGRSKPLQEGMRRALWAVYQAYQEVLAQEDLLDWADVAWLACLELNQDAAHTRFDHVLIDEAQDMSLLQLKAAQKLAKEEDGRRSVFLVGDIGQTIYSRGFAWRQAGLEVTGKSHTLRRNYRNTVQIARAAKHLNEHNHIMLASGEYVAPEFSVRQGNPPLVLACAGEDQCKGAIYEEILRLTEQGLFRVGDCAVICPTNDLCRQFHQYFTSRGLQSLVHRDANFDILEAQVKILTIHSAKGLEFPVVFVAGVTEGCLPRERRELDEEDRDLALERERTLLYVAMTRAAEMLYLVTCKNKESRFLAEIVEVTGHREMIQNQTDIK
jgi:superfamily I DNA/RNA helicase